MKNQYVGDLSDFAKYGILRALAGVGRQQVFRLGVVWYLTPDHGGGGSHIRYLSEPRPNRYSEADPHLYGRLRHVVDRLGRDVRHVQAAGVLPARTAFYSEPLTFRQIPPRRIADRLQQRAAWLDGALAAMARCDLVILDPDNGLAPPGVRRHTDAGTQYTFLDELRSFVDLGKAVVLIQFFRRDVPRTEQIRQRVHEIRAVIPGDAPPLALWWRHRVSLAFCLVPATPEQAVILRGRAQRLLGSPWGRFYEPVPDYLCECPVYPSRS
jgi:hypothetical protein